MTVAVILSVVFVVLTVDIRTGTGIPATLLDRMFQPLMTRDHVATAYADTVLCALDRDLCSEVR